MEDVKRHVFKVRPSHPVRQPNHRDGADSPQGVNTSLPDPLSYLHSDLSEWGSQDVAIAAFLMLLWKDMYPPRQPSEKEGTEEWETWGRPENGFVDLGCVSHSFQISQFHC